MTVTQEQSGRYMCMWIHMWIPFCMEPTQVGLLTFTVIGESLNFISSFLPQCFHSAPTIISFFKHVLGTVVSIACTLVNKTDRTQCYIMNSACADRKTCDKFSNSWDIRRARLCTHIKQCIPQANITFGWLTVLDGGWESGKTLILYQWETGNNQINVQIT